MVEITLDHDNCTTNLHQWGGAGGEQDGHNTSSYYVKEVSSASWRRRTFANLSFVAHFLLLLGWVGWVEQEGHDDAGGSERVRALYTLNHYRFFLFQ